jgi:hypothetical protein
MTYGRVSLFLGYTVFQTFHHTFVDRLDLLAFSADEIVMMVVPIGTSNLVARGAI